MSKDKVLQVRVTPEHHAAITTLSVQFDMTLSAIVRNAIVLMLGAPWVPFTANEAQEVIRLDAAIAQEANDDAPLD